MEWRFERAAVSNLIPVSVYSYSDGSHGVRRGCESAAFLRRIEGVEGYV